MQPLKTDETQNQISTQFSIYGKPYFNINKYNTEGSENVKAEKLRKKQ